VVVEFSNGDAFGEMALMQEKASLRNASAKCATNSSIAVLS